MRQLLLITAFGLAATACSPHSAFDDGQGKYAYLLHYGASRGELCKQALIVRDAAANERRDVDYLAWSDRVRDQCGAAA